MKRSKKQLQSKTNFSTFCNLIPLILNQNCVKGFRVTKIVKEIKSEGVWGKLKAKNSFYRQPFTKYLRLTQIPCEIALYGKSLISVFQEVFASINKVFILAG